MPLLGRFIADFLAPAERLVIEVDGGHHTEQARADAHRDAVLARAGYRVLGPMPTLEAQSIRSRTEDNLIELALRGWVPYWKCRLSRRSA